MEPVITHSPRRTRRFGAYDLLDKIGQGGMSSVYKARHSGTGDVAAIKIASRAVINDVHLSRRFELEYDVAHRLNHPNLVKVLGNGKSDQVPYLVMEYVDGPSLAQILKIHARLSEQDALAIMLRTASAVTYLHNNQIVHRDIKPANIILNSVGDAKLADLGLVKNLESLSRLTRSNIGLGTIQFASPEQFDDARAADPRSDIYSLAATMYVLVTGMPPFGKGSMLHVLNRKLQNQFDSPISRVPGLSPYVDAAIRSGLQADREKRPASVAEFIAPLQDAQKGRPVSVSQTAALAIKPKLDPSDSSAEKNASKERRNGVRFAVEVEAKCRAVANSGGQHWPAWIVDVSSHGLCLRMPRRFEVGSGLEVYFTVHGEAIGTTQLAQVRWVKAAESKSWLLGCQFLKPIPDDVLNSMIEDFMELTRMT
jgi:eukaryotic-like serine/threonine-protein kinase